MQTSIGRQKVLPDRLGRGEEGRCPGSWWALEKICREKSNQQSGLPMSPSLCLTLTLQDSTLSPSHVSAMEDVGRNHKRKEDHVFCLMFFLHPDASSCPWGIQKLFGLVSCYLSPSLKYKFWRTCSWMILVVSPVLFLLSSSHSVNSLEGIYSVLRRHLQAVSLRPEKPYPGRGEPPSLRSWLDPA